MSLTIKPLDYGDLNGGLARMMDRFWEQGTLTGDPEADAYLRQDPNAALLGLLYDQRVRAEYAFTGPHRLRDRLGHLDMKQIAAMPLDRLRALFAEKPAVHRFTNVMADRTHAVARILAASYDGNAANLWNDGADFPTIERRIRKLPGFGPLKARKMRYVLHYFGYRDFSGT
ncbi:hypothetical protein GQ464_016800 [Rhodocaloribacter litoris]|uniref:hypothetical protein n=1 Tax=Rhodocaloribacter litoris TaxID=2558931 RepID=UPI00141F0576|nr:hypothetical protein [Rhodocaloribacter litoris]QXD15044.1 hypothetical protein GQ464_016800 [Rhodocaloribacter litoris]GIV62160.1 MAG: hypothetical protein KatS3mg044_1026 [Rhodothermaceae bacterium]